MTGPTVPQVSVKDATVLPILVTVKVAVCATVLGSHCTGLPSGVTDTPNVNGGGHPGGVQNSGSTTRVSAGSCAVASLGVTVTVKTRTKEAMSHGARASTRDSTEEVAHS